MNLRQISTGSALSMTFAMLMSVGVAANAQESAEVQGLIVGRNGPTMYVKTYNNQRQIVVLSDNTPATEKGGLFGMSHKDLGVAALVPGLEVKVDGSYDGDHQLLAKRVEFSRGSLKTAKQIDAGMTPTNEKMAAQQDAIMSARRDIDTNTQGLSDANGKIAANGAAIDAANQQIGATNGRIGQLDQFEEKGSVTVNFKNGSAVVSKKDKDALNDFLKTTADTQGYMVQVQGYASKTGNAAINQKLSSERADAVLTIIQQSGAVPLTRILAPAAMGTVEQVADNHSRAGQAQNRRVVVTIMVNKGITGGTDASTTPRATPAAAPAANAPGN